MDHNRINREKLIDEALGLHFEREREQRVAVTLHSSVRHSWQWATAVVCAVVVAVVIWAERPKVWGEVNGREIYSLEEAQFYAQRMLDDMKVEELQPQEDVLRTIFTLD